MVNRMQVLVRHRALKDAERRTDEEYSKRQAARSPEEQTELAHAERALRKASAELMVFRKANARELAWAEGHKQTLRAEAEERSEASRIDGLRAAGHHELAHYETLRRGGPDRAVERAIYSRLHRPAIEAQASAVTEEPEHANVALAELVEAAGGREEATAILFDED